MQNDKLHSEATGSDIFPSLCLANYRLAAKRVHMLVRGDGLVSPRCRGISFAALKTTPRAAQLRARPPHAWEIG